MESGRAEGLAQNKFYDIVFLFCFFIDIYQATAQHRARESPWTTHTVNIHFYWDKGLYRQHARAGGGFTTRRTLRRKKKKTGEKKRKHTSWSEPRPTFSFSYTQQVRQGSTLTLTLYTRPNGLLAGLGLAGVFPFCPAQQTLKNIRHKSIKRKKKIKKVGITPHPSSLLLPLFL